MTPNKTKGDAMAKITSRGCTEVCRVKQNARLSPECRVQTVRLLRSDGRVLTKTLFFQTGVSGVAHKTEWAVYRKVSGWPEGRVDQAARAESWLAGMALLGFTHDGNPAPEPVEEPVTQPTTTEEQDQGPGPVQDEADYFTGRP